MSQGELLQEYTLQGRVDTSIAMLRHFNSHLPLFGCFSGGKDSIVIKHLARMAGINIDWHYSVTQIDPPDLMRFVRREHPDVAWARVKGHSFFRDVAKKGLPTRRVRWCCAIYKEASRPDRGETMVMGVRASESARRAKSWKEMGVNRQGVMTILPIFHWKDSEVWEFIHAENLPYCHLYDCGLKRLGCVGCPMARPREKEIHFSLYPRFKECYLRAWRKYWEANAEGNESRTYREFKSADAFFEWWLTDKSMPSATSACLNPQLDIIEEYWDTDAIEAGWRET